MDGLFTALKAFDFEKMLPELGAYVGGLKFWAWVLLMVAPVLLWVLGTLYTKRPPEDFDCAWAFGGKRAKESRKNWEKAHRLAGKAWTSIGTIMCGVGVFCGILFFMVNALAAATIAVCMIVLELILIVASRSSVEKKL